MPSTPEFICNFEKREAPGVGNLDYESRFSASVPVVLSPERVVIVNPLTHIPVEWSKTVGCCCGKLAHIKVEVEKNFYEVGEIANMTVSVDNSNVKQACTLEIRHVTMMH